MIDVTVSGTSIIVLRTAHLLVVARRPAQLSQQNPAHDAQSELFC
jgi:hypothetical protein